MIFISTCNQDNTTDILLKEFNPNDVFRFDIDKHKGFVWDFHKTGFNVKDKVS